MSEENTAQTNSTAETPINKALVQIAAIIEDLKKLGIDTAHFGNGLCALSAARDNLAAHLAIHHE